MAGLSLGTGLSPRVGLSNGVGLGSGQLDGVSEAANFSNTFTSALAADWTFTRTGDQSFNDHEPLVKTETEDNQPAFVGARRVENLATGVTTESVTVVSGNEYRVTIAGDNLAQVVLSGAASDTIIADGTNRITGSVETAATTTLTCTVTGTLTELMVEDVSGQANQNPSEFVDGVAYYATENGNTANLLNKSQEFDNAAWTKTNSSITADQTTSPDLSVNADLYDEGAATGYHLISQPETVPDTGTVETLSFYAKYIDLPQMGYRLNIGGSWVDCIFDIQSETVVSSTGYDSASVTDAGSGWVRCSATFTSRTDQLIQILSFSSGAGSYTGTNRTSYIWGSYLNVGSSAATYGADNVVTEATGSALSGLEGLLLECRTNLLTYSEEFDNAAWSKTRAVIDANVTTAPDGTETADRLKDDNAGGALTVKAIISGYGNVTSGQPYCSSIYAKADGLDWIRISSINFDSDAECFFDLTNGVVGSSTGDSQGIEDVGNGWYRCWVTDTTTTDLAGAFEVNPADGDNDYTVDRDDTSSVFVWGAQGEVGAFPSSYIKTTTASATRNATALTMTRALPLNGYSFQLKLTMNHDYTESANQDILQVNTNPTGSTYIEIDCAPGTGRFALTKRQGASVTLRLSSGSQVTFSKGDEVNLRGRMDTDGMKFWVDDKTPLSTASGNADWGTIPEDHVFYAEAYVQVKEFNVWHEAKSDDFLSGLS